MSAQFYYHTTNSIQIPDNATAHSTLDVYGLMGKVVSTEIGLQEVSHEYPADLDMLLVGPDGQHNLAFMTDAGGSDDFNYLDLSFSDNGIPLFQQFKNGATYLPVDLGTTESGSNWGLPGLTINHASNGSSFASSFGGIYGNGQWSLYVRDDDPGAKGDIDGWSLKITTAEDAGQILGTSGADTITVATTDLAAGAGLFHMNLRGNVFFSHAYTFSLSGYAGDDVIKGDQEVDHIRGGAGKDSISAGANADTIHIGANEDVGGETYDGGAGYDTLVVDGYATIDLRDDTVKDIETIYMKMGGKLQVNAWTLNGVQSISGTMDINHPDVLEVTMGAGTHVDVGIKDLKGFIDAGDKVVILGDNSGESIFGSKVNDLIKAGGGKDLISANEGMDTVNGGDGRDTISYLTRKAAINVTLDGRTRVGVMVDGVLEDKIKNVENVTSGSAADILKGDGHANTFKSYEGNDRLKGFGGNDKLEGGLGVDSVWGGSGKDQFIFASPIDAADHLKDFSHADDTIVLNKAVFGAFTSLGAIDSAMFRAHTSGHAAHTVNQHLIYDKAEHSLWYDADGSGNGAAIEVAVFDNGIKNLDFHDFLIV